MICKRKHHLLLHPESAQVQQQLTYSSSSSDSDTTSDSTYVSCAYQQARKPNSSDGFPPLETTITYLTVWMKNPTNDTAIKVNMLADSGANCCSIDTDLAHRLGLQGQAQPYHVQVGGGRINTYAAYGATVLVRGVQDGAEEYAIKVQVYDTPCGSLGAINWAEKKTGWKHLKSLDLPTSAEGRVDGIIGMSEPTLIAAIEPAVMGRRYEPVATKTKLGWFIGGPTKDRANKANLNVTFMNNEKDVEQEKDGYEQLRRDLQRFWGPTDQLGPPPATTTKLEQRAIDVFNRTKHRLSNGQYEVGLLWKNGYFVPRNERAALSMFKRLEQQMDRVPKMRENFNTTVQEWLNKNIASYVRPTEIHYYLPTFMVVRTDKLTSAYRLVVDGSRKFSGVCLNDRLLAGPSMINHVFDVLCRMRMGEHAFTCDVQTMYLNVKVRPADRKYLGMYYRPQSSDNLQVLQLSSHPFGLTSSPYVAMGVVKHHAEQRQVTYPLAKQAVDTHVIVDDFIVSGDNVTRLRDTLTQLEGLLSEIGMGVHKIAASHHTIVKGIEPEKIAKSMRLGGEGDLDWTSTPTVKTLGVVWDTETDIMRLEFKPRWIQDDLTLRMVVSDCGRFYDPLGLALPVLMSGRILQQACWSTSTDWDTVLPLGMQQRWKRWAKNSMHISSFKIPRGIKRNGEPIHKQRLITFVDASSEAQAAVVYVQTLYQSGKLEARFLCSKGKISSLTKQESIPRLECAAAAMGATLGHKVATLLNWDPTLSLYFSDSMTTLWWIMSEKPLKVFVANRICAILDVSRRDQWRHVKTGDNPADLPTRTASIRMLRRSELWNFGPTFLTLPEKEWEQRPPLEAGAEAKEETKDLEAILDKVHVQDHSSDYSPVGCWLRQIWEQRSSPSKGMNITAYVYHMYQIFKKQLPERYRHGSSLAEKREWCLRYLIKEEQAKYLPLLHRELQSNKAPTGRQASWRPFIDSHGVIRINGRLGYEWTIPYEQRRPIFLTKRMPLALEIAKLWHVEKLRHTGGPAALLTALRTQFWIENGTVVAKQAIRECASCQSLRAHDIPYQTSPLHASRFDAVRPFSHIGIDMFGPMEVKRGRGRQREKRYGIIFTCCFTRAINVEVAADASAASCFMAFKRHAATYGQPNEVNSDRGTNFIMVRSTIHDLQNVWEETEPLIKENYPDIKWTLNPPRTPSFGGHFESLIKTIKQAFKTLVKWPRYLLTDEELSTGLKEAAGMANMRPVTPMSGDPHDFPPIRPSDLLNAPTLNVLPNWNEKQLVYNIKTELDKLKQEVWEKMRTEILTNMQRLKDFHQIKDLEVGEIVLLRNQDWRADRWPLARVMEVMPGQDGIVRVAKVRHVVSKDNKPVIKESIQSVRNMFRMRTPPGVKPSRLSK